MRDVKCPIGIAVASGGVAWLVRDRAKVGMSVGASLENSFIIAWNVSFQPKLLRMVCSGACRLTAEWQHCKDKLQTLTVPCLP